MRRPHACSSPRLVLAALGCSALLAAGAAPVHAAAAPIAPYQEVVSLVGTHPARSAPAIDGPLVASVRARRPITGQRTVLPVLGQSIDSVGRSWLHVRLPGRALGGKTLPPAAWILAAGTEPASTAWHLVVDRAARRVIVYRDGRAVHTYRAIVGKASTPTPRGEYFVEENVRMPANHAGAPFALALSARSSVFQEFEGGPGQIALHGINNVGGQLGTAVSHGCVRLSTADITWLATHIGAGVPVTIR